MAMRQRFEARGIFRLPLEAFAEAPTECVPAPAFGKIELRVEQLYHQTVRQPLPPCISFCFRFGPLYGRQALALFTVSDHLLTGEKCTAEERQTTFNDMIEIALATAVG